VGKGGVRRFGNESPEAQAGWRGKRKSSGKFLDQGSSRIPYLQGKRSLKEQADYNHGPPYQEESQWKLSGLKKKLPK